MNEVVREPKLSILALLAMFRDYERWYIGDSVDAVEWRGEFLAFVLWVADELGNAMAMRVAQNEAALQQSRAVAESVTNGDLAKREGVGDGYKLKP